jgi:hypothetical protein
VPPKGRSLSLVPTPDKALASVDTSDAWPWLLAKPTAVAVPFDVWPACIAYIQANRAALEAALASALASGAAAGDVWLEMDVEGGTVTALSREMVFQFNRLDYQDFEAPPAACVPVSILTPDGFERTTYDFTPYDFTPRAKS